MHDVDDDMVKHAHSSTYKKIAEYADLVTEWRITKRVSEQFNAFHVGLLEMLPQELLSVFDEKELELLIGGIAEIDVDDWQKNTLYKGYTADDQVIQWFWKVRRVNRVLVYRVCIMQPISIRR